MDATDESAKRAFMAELLNDASIDCVIAMDTELRVTSWNKTCESLSGRLKGEVLGKRLDEIFPDLAVSKVFLNALANGLLGLKSFVPVRGGSMSGEYMETHVIPLKDAQEQTIGLLIIRHDVAHRQHAEQELKRLNRELQQRNEELISFAKVTSHDLKEPLRKISVFTSMLLDIDQNTRSNEEQALLSRIKKSANKAEALTDDIFTFWQLQNVSEPIADVNLTMALKVARQQLQEVIKATDATIDLQTLPMIVGYPMLIQQLFRNILENAFKFQNAGAVPHVAISSRTVKGDTVPHLDGLRNENYAAVIFTDNGIGFDQQYADRAFELFQRLHNPVEYPGNGTGLSLCRKIMDLHHGLITAESMPGKGSTFTCYFPSA